MSGTKQPVNQNRDLKTAIPGPKSTALRTREDAHLAPGAQGYALMAGIAIETARGSAVTDVDGNTFLDFIGGIGVGALGHSHPTMVAALKDQVAAGVEALREAWVAAIEGVALERHAERHPSLQAALGFWK